MINENQGTENKLTRENDATNESDYQLQLDIIDSTDESCYRNWKKRTC